MRRLVVVVALVGALAGCTTDTDDHHDDGHMGDGHHTSVAGNLAYTGSEDVLWSVVAGDPEEFRFVPDDFTVQRGQTVGVTFRNDGNAPHELSIEAFDFHIHLEAGEEGQASFATDQEGTFTFGCYIPGHFESGMKGSLDVTP